MRVDYGIKLDSRLKLYSLIEGEHKGLFPYKVGFEHEGVFSYKGVFAHTGKLHLLVYSRIKMISFVIYTWFSTQT